MTRAKSSLPPAYFENMFAENDDPWDLESSPYEREKYARTLDALGDRRYNSGFEVGCAKGMLTKQLAEHCDELFAIDVSATALYAARMRCAALSHVQFANMAFPAVSPSRSFDLVVLSEVVYYWDDLDIARAGAWLAEHVERGGDLILVHWTGETDYPQSADDAVSKLKIALGRPVTALREERADKYRLDLWRKQV